MQEFLTNQQLIKDQKLVPALYVVSTPIGNLGDITLRAIEVLQKCDFVVGEDSRVTAKLLNRLEIKKSFITYNDHSDQLARDKILNFILSGKVLALVSDAGTPLISDPGYKLVEFLLENNAKVTSVPGACSVIAALTISGIASNRFMFVGFTPHSEIARQHFFKDLVNIDSSLIFFESANRLLVSLEVMLQIFGNREVAVVREITKIYEETKKAKLTDLISYYRQNSIKGEVVVLLSPPSKNTEVDMEVVDQELRSGIKTVKPKDLVALVADQYGLNKKVLYQRMLQIIKNDQG